MERSGTITIPREEIMGLLDPLPPIWRERLLSLLRIVAGFVFMLHGTQKLLAWPVSEPQPTVELASLMGVAGVLELVGGFLILIGLFTRPVAFILAGEMAVAYFMAHQPRGGWPIQNGGELAALYCFLFLFIATRGAGRLSLDGGARKR